MDNDNKNDVDKMKEMGKDKINEEKLINKDKKKFDINDLKNIDLNSIDDEYINNIYQKIFTKYKDLGGDGRVAKSTNFITEVDSAIFSNGDDN